MNAVHSIDAVPYVIGAAGGDDDEEGIIQRALAILTKRIRRGPLMDSPIAVRQYLTMKAAKNSDREVFSVLFLNTQHEIIEFQEMFFGTLTQTSVYPREVAKVALELGANAVILTHNHPSGSTKPSKADEQLTSTLKSALSLIDVRVLDHIITAGGDSLSMAEAGLM